MCAAMVTKLFRDEVHWSKKYENIKTRTDKHKVDSPENDMTLNPQPLSDIARVIVISALSSSHQ